MTTVADVAAAAELLWPSALADEWDRPGLVAGSGLNEVKSVLLSVDVTLDLLSDAVGGGFDMIVSHHPFLLRGVHEVTEQSAKGAVLSAAIKNSVALFAAHTNADVVEDGVSDTLAKAFELLESVPLVSTESSAIGHGRIGRLAKPTSLIEFSRAVAAVLPATAGGVRVAGDPQQVIERVALCGGAGDSFIDFAIAQHADVYVTSDLRHHPSQDALERAKALNRDFALIDTSHWATESMWLQVAAQKLRERLPDVKFVVSDLRTDPWDFAVTQ